MMLFRVALAALALSLFPGCLPAQAAAAQASTTSDLQSKAPAIVFIIRHAEKPIEDKDPNLTAQGFQRARTLPALFLPQPGAKTLPRLPRPAALFATAPSKHSNRPIETITPLSQALNLRINSSYEDRETTSVAKEVLSGRYAGKVVLICWHHGEIPDMAKAFGVEDAPKKWDDTVFDRIWMIEWIDGKPQFSTLPEKLLPGDAQSE